MTDPFAPDPEQRWHRPTPIHELFSVLVALAVFVLSVVAYGAVFIAVAAALPRVDPDAAASGFYICCFVGFAFTATVVSLVAAVRGASWVQLRVLALGRSDTCHPQVF